MDKKLPATKGFIPAGLDESAIVIASLYFSSGRRVSIWLKTIYENLFDFNFQQQALFQKVGIKICLYFSHYDSSCGIYTSLSVVSRELDTFSENKHSAQ